MLAPVNHTNEGLSIFFLDFNFFDSTVVAVRLEFLTLK